MDAKVYLYRVFISYYADEEFKQFTTEVTARDGYEAQEIVIGQTAWSESVTGHTFKLDGTDYRCID